MRVNRSKVIGGLALSAALVLSACGSSSPKQVSQGPHIGGTLVDLQNFNSGDPQFVDPALAYEASAVQLDALLFSGLTTTDAKGQPQKAVASNYTSNADATVWTFTLRPNVQFSDGSPVLASSFKHAWLRILNPALDSSNAGRMAEFQLRPDATDLSNVVADDAARTLTITLAQPDRDLPSLLALPTFSPLPADAPLDKSLDGTKLIGDGPYVMDAPIQPNKQIDISRNPSYYGGPDQRPPYLDHINFVVSQSAQAAYNDFAAGHGQLAAFPGMASADLQKYEKQDIVNNPTMGVEYWGFNMSDPTVGGAANLKLRQAINMAIDKSAINQQAYGGTHAVASQFSPPNTPGSTAQPTSGTPDVAGAKKLLAEWGKTPPTIKVSFNTDAGHDDVAATIVQNLNAIGIHAVSNPLDLDTYRNDLTAGSLQFFRFEWDADYPSYRLMIEPSFSSSGGAESVNYTRYNNPAVDKLFAQALQDPSSDMRNGLYRQSEALIMADQPVVPLDWTSADLIKTPEVQNLTTDPIGFINYADIWLQPQTTTTTK